MNRFERKITLRVVAIHIAVVGLLVLQSLLHGCFRPKPKPEMVTFVDMADPAPPVQVQEVQQISNPEPQPEPPQKTSPVPEQPKVKVPEPVKKTVKPIKKTVKPPKKTVKPPVVKPKSTWKPVSPDQIKKGKRVNATPSKPTISKSEIQKQLGSIVKSPATSGSPNEFADYYARIMRLFYQHWTPPESASSASGSTIVRISIRPNGQVVKRAKVKSSGDPVYDDSAMDAARSISSLPPPPANYPYDYVEVVFTLEN